MFDHLTADKLSELSEEEILAAAETLKTTIDSATEALDRVKQELGQRVDDMRLSPQFTHNGWKFSQKNGRRTWEYPLSVLQLQEQLKSAQSQAQADGSATAITGRPFWEIAREKSKKGAA